LQKLQNSNVSFVDVFKILGIQPYFSTSLTFTLHAVLKIPNTSTQSHVNSKGASSKVKSEIRNKIKAYLILLSGKGEG